MHNGPIALTPLYETPPPASAWVEKDVALTMRDETHIAVDVYRPQRSGAFPTLYAVSPYRKDLIYLPPTGVYRFRECGDIGWWLSKGYAFVHADVRGSGHSREGQWQLHGLPEQLDLYDTIEWIAAQSWSNGKVGMMGESYYGALQWFAAQQQPPHLAAIAPYDAFCDTYRDVSYHGGVPCAGFPTWWSYNTRALTLLDQPGPHPEEIMGFDIIGEGLRHPLDGPFWRERSVDFTRIKTPFYSIGNWNMVGVHLRGNLLAYECINAPKKLLVYGGEGHHASIDFFNSLELHEELRRWFDYWLKGERNSVMDEHPVKVFVRGKGEGFRDEPGWPPQRAQYRQLYLHGKRSGSVDSLNDGSLSWDAPPSSEDTTVFRYPQEAWGGWPGLGSATLVSGIPNTTRAILTFTSAPMARDLEILGPIVLHLYAASDQADTDFIVKISDQHPRSLLALPFLPTPSAWVTRGFLRASHAVTKDALRSTEHRPYYAHDHPQLLEPGRIYHFEIEIWPTSWVFEKGHRIRLELANADSPVFDAPFSHHYGTKIGTDTLYHDAQHPSHLELPVIARSRSGGV